MDLINFIFLPGIILLGIITSYQDIKFGKIKNKWIIASLIYVIVGYVFLILYYKNTNKIISQSYLLEILTNLLFSIAVGFGLWIIGIWTAGDGKLFIAYASLVPFSFYSIGYIDWIPSFVLLINIFTLSFFIIFFSMLSKTRLKQINKTFSEIFKDIFNIKKLLKSVLQVFSIFWLVQVLFSFFNIRNNSVIIIILSIVVILLVNKDKLGMKDLGIIIFLLIALARIFIDRTIYSWNFLINFILTLIVFQFLMSLINGSVSKISRKIFSKEINVEELKVGMVLSESVIKEGRFNKKQLDDLLKNSSEEIELIKQQKSYMDLKNIINEEPEGLTLLQINKLKKIGLKKIRVSQTVPFAPFIFGGVLITLVIKGNILVYIRMLF